MSKYRYETKMVPTDFSAVVEGVPLTTMQIEQQNKEIRRAEELITSVINQLDEEKGMKLFSHSVHFPRRLDSPGAQESSPECHRGAQEDRGARRSARGMPRRTSSTTRHRRVDAPCIAGGQSRTGTLGAALPWSLLSEAPKKTDCILSILDLDEFSFSRLGISFLENPQSAQIEMWPFF